MADSIIAPRRKHATPLEDYSFLISRVYYNYIGMLERTIAEMGLDEVLAGNGNVLFALYERDGRIIKELAQRVSMSQSSLTKTLQRMERAGIVERRRDSADGRATRVTLTPLGRSIEPQCKSLARRMELVLLKGMTKEEGATLRILTVRAIDNLRRVNAGPEQKKTGT